MGSSQASRRQGNLINLASRKPLATSGTSNVVVASTGNPVKPSQISFDRKELNALLRVYSFMVAAGEWKDYAIDQLRERAIFSVYRKASEAPLFQIVKEPALARKQGAYAVFAQSGAMLKRGQDINQLLRLFDRKLKAVE